MHWRGVSGEEVPPLRVGYMHMHGHAALEGPRGGARESCAAKGGHHHRHPAVRIPRLVCLHLDQRHVEARRDRTHLRDYEGLRG